ncbi:galactosyldiacylglycerol synthase [Opitutus sp. ER46]|uniref:MGDG synthase family glycosyltransferase n=1 Tax=Opitutus sp. ER46 TaxID=2161864 RepID=UPI000D313ADE|nr:galactosyldiacylglycerol synthase [Opitutus sp. ER46]PTY01095.1 galactosyldiacylglycerol synthase [Opitutus sp. ER46]
MTPRILYLTAGFGEGHNAAARALADATAERFGSGSAPILDAFAVARPRLNQHSRRFYLRLINQAPRAWSAFYRWLDRSPRADRYVTLLRRELDVLAERIRRERPVALCSTYPVYGFMVAELRRRGLALPPLFTVVTDSITINGLWWRAPSAGWFVPNADSAVVLARAGVGPVHTLGFPVSPVFADDGARLLRPDPGPGVPPRILYLVHSGNRDAFATARRLLAEPGWDVTCAVGRDEGLRTALMRLADDRVRSTPILGWTPEVPRLLMTHHVVVSKAGGATTQEALAAGCPMIVNQVVPGQEEGNSELLRRHGIGALATTPDAVHAAIARAFAEGAREWRGWRAAVDRLARPDAARAIVNAMLLETAPPVRSRPERVAAPLS